MHVCLQKNARARTHTHITIGLGKFTVRGLALTSHVQAAIAPHGAMGLYTGDATILRLRGEST